MADGEIEITSDHYSDYLPTIKSTRLANPEGSEMAEGETEVTSDHHRDCPPHVNSICLTNSDICLANPEGSEVAEGETEVTSDHHSDCPPPINSTGLANPEGSEMAERETEVTSDHHRDCPPHVNSICLTNPEGSEMAEGEAEVTSDHHSDGPPPINSTGLANPEGSKMAERETEVASDHHRDCPPHVNSICLTNTDICLANPEGSEMAERGREITGDHHRDCPPHVNGTCLANPEGSTEESQESIEMHILPIRERFFKVPASHRRANKDAFDPRFFSFGPYHAGAASLSEGEQLKCLVARDLIDSDGLERLVSRIQEDESRLRDVYVSMSEVQHAELARILALDSIFLVYAALRNGRLPAFITYESREDALLLESQIPTFVLKYALESLGCSSESLANVLKYYYTLGASLSPFPKGNGLASLETRAVLNEKASLLGHVYDYLTETGGRSDAIENHEEDDSQVLLVKLPTASHLAKSGLTFRPCDSCFCGIESIENSWELRLPRINVGDNKLCFLSNLLAYEATNKETHFQPVSSYIAVMNQLIDTKEDWQVLMDAGVITNLAGGHLEFASSWIKRLSSSVPGFLTEADRTTIKRVLQMRGWWVAFTQMRRCLATQASLKWKLLSRYLISFLIFISMVPLFKIFSDYAFKILSGDPWPPVPFPPFRHGTHNGHTFIYYPPAP